MPPSVLELPGLLGFVAGAWVLQQQGELPSPLGQVALAGIASGLLGLWRLIRRKQGRPLPALALCCAAGLLGFSWSAWRADLRLADALPTAWEGRDVVVTGVVASLPDRIPRGLRFDFAITDVRTPGARVPPRISLAWYENSDADGLTRPEQVEPGERWQLQVRLRRPHGNANPEGFDYEGWLLEQGVRATGYVRPAPTDTRSGAIQPAANQRLAGRAWWPLLWVEAARARLRSGMERALGDAPYAGVLIALVIGDQRGIDQHDWQVFARTGISHLVSISGLHVTMLAGAAAALARWLWRGWARRSGRPPLGLSAPQWAALTGFTVALAYCLIAGMGVPAQRTLVMLAVVALALWLERPVAAARVLCLALFLVVLLDPWAVLAAGFWLSFGAVGLIFYVVAGRIAARPAPGLRVRLLTSLLAAGRVQWAMTLGLVPLTLLLFHQVSLVSPFANAVAIPLVSFVVTPLAMVGALLPGLPGDLLLQAAHAVMAALAGLLGWCAALPWAIWPAPVAPLWATVLGLAGVAWALAPPGWPARLLGVLALLPALFWPHQRPVPGHLRVTVLDVGQGSAVLLETSAHRYLYDTGPSYSPESDAGSRVVLPYLRARGIGALDGLIVSHRDSDHSGGALSILAALPVAWLASSLAADDPIARQAARPLRCVAGAGWSSGGFRFDFLHPSVDSYGQARKPNARSCVLRVHDPARPEVPALLLTADIERPQERELLGRYPPEQFSGALLLVPHHGSLTSSSDEFLDAVRPRVALVQAGYLNRFGHPRPAVLQRYAERAVPVWRTDQTGALRFEIGGAAPVVEAWRVARPRYWMGR